MTRTACANRPHGRACRNKARKNDNLCGPCRDAQDAFDAQAAEASYPGDGNGDGRPDCCGFVPCSTDCPSHATGAAEQAAPLPCGYCDSRDHTTEAPTCIDPRDEGCGGQGPRDGYQPAKGRNLIAEKRARLDAPKRTRGRKSGDPRADRPFSGAALLAHIAAAAGPAAVAPDAHAGLLEPLTASTYPPATEGAALCLGACGEVKPISRFQWVGPRATATGRMVECTPCQLARLERNKAAKAEGREPEPKPRALQNA